MPFWDPRGHFDFLRRRKNTTDLTMADKLLPYSEKIAPEKTPQEKIAEEKTSQEKIPQEKTSQEKIPQEQTPQKRILRKRIPQKHDSLSISPKRDPVTQLRRYLVEIMAFSFQSDFALLNETLGQPTSPDPDSESEEPPAYSTLFQDELDELRRLAWIINELHKNRRGHGWLTTRDADRQAIADAIIFPALRLELSPDYALRTILCYADHECDESKQRYTLIAMAFKADPHFEGYQYSVSAFEEHLHAHACLVYAAAPDENIRIMLGRAMKGFQKGVERKRKKVPIKEPGADYNRWPDKYSSWYYLWKSLVTSEEERQIGNEIYQRKRNEARKRVGGSRWSR